MKEIRWDVSYLSLFAIHTNGQGGMIMELEDLTREIVKVTKQGGIARVPETMVMESMDCPDELECRERMSEWIAGLCGEYHLTRDHDKDMFGQEELLFTYASAPSVPSEA